MFGAERVLPDEHRSQACDITDGRRLLPGDARFTNTADAFVGFDDDEEEIPLVSDNVRSDGCDFHVIDFLRMRIRKRASSEL